MEAGVGVTEVDGGRKWEIDGTLGLPVVANFVFDEMD